MMFKRKRSTGDKNLEEVHLANGLLQGEIVKGRLEAEGIPVLLKYESLGPVMGLTIDGLGEVQVLVPMDMAEQARSILAEAALSEDEIPWNESDEEGEDT
jgi:hypothetical protein